ncbi:hypothetical protein V494_03113 [Pseudogymnoascus sp. VKM F-4513 (FW-928)]|nr:hypothetical protein V494_03113 [Pseudogymnoascus sp. VKM F-4513 (FW-928)]
MQREVNGSTEKPEAEVQRTTGDKGIGWDLPILFVSTHIASESSEAASRGRGPPPWHIWEQSDRSTTKDSTGMTGKKTATEGHRAASPALRAKQVWCGGQSWAVGACFTGGWYKPLIAEYPGFVNEVIDENTAISTGETDSCHTKISQDVDMFGESSQAMVGSGNAGVDTEVGIDSL